MLGHFLAIGLGGFLGAIARYSLSSLVFRLTNHAFPFGTLAVNLLGCFLMGFSMYLFEAKHWFPPQARLMLVTGFLGSLTTFSTFGYETLTLLKSGAFWFVFLNLILNLLGSLFAVYVGYLLAEKVLSP